MEVAETSTSELGDFDLCMDDLGELFGNRAAGDAGSLTALQTSVDPLPHSVAERVSLDGLAPDASYQTGYSEHTLALKFHGSTPIDLPKNILTDIQRNLPVTPSEAFFEGTIRPGCTHVSLRIRVQEGEEADRLRSLGIESLAKALSMAWKGETRALSKGVELQLAGSVTHVGSDGSSFTVRSLPEIAVSPEVVQSGMQAEFDVTVDNIDLNGTAVAVFCRQNGKYLTTSIVPEDFDDFSEGSEGEDWESEQDVEDVEGGVVDRSLDANAGETMATSLEDDLDLILERDTATSYSTRSSRSISGRESITSEDTIDRSESDFVQESRIRVRVIGLVPGSCEIELMMDNVLTAPVSVLALPTSYHVADARRLLCGATRAQQTGFIRDAGLVVRHVFSPESLLPSDLPMIQRLAVKTCEWAMECRSSHLVRILQEALPPENACCGDCGEVSADAHGTAMSDRIGLDRGQTVSGHAAHPKLSESKEAAIAALNSVDMAYPPELKTLSTRLCETYELEAERAVVQEICAEISPLDVDEKRTLLDASSWKSASLQVVLGAILVILTSST